METTQTKLKDLKQALEYFKKGNILINSGNLILHPYLANHKDVYDIWVIDDTCQLTIKEVKIINLINDLEKKENL